MTNHAEPADAASRSQDVPEAVTVLLLDDHPALLASLKEAVEADDTLTVVGAVGRIPDAIGLAVATQPRVAVIDVNMPDGGGWAAARGLRAVSYTHLLGGRDGRHSAGGRGGRDHHAWWELAGKWGR